MVDAILGQDAAAEILRELILLGSLEILFPLRADIILFQLSQLLLNTYVRFKRTVIFAENCFGFV